MYKYCIIGGGPGGLVLSRALSEKTDPKDIVILEAGTRSAPNIDAAKFISMGKTRYEPIRQFMLGGHGHLWGGACPRLNPADFKMKSQFGLYVDWPVSYEEIEPYYSIAEGFLNVGSRWGAAEPPSGEDPVFDSIKQNGYAGTVPYGNRNYFTEKLIPELDKKAINIIENAVAQRIDENDDSTATVSYFDEDEAKLKSLNAQYVIVACGGLSNSRLLQISKSKRYPNGIGNHSGHLGCYLMDHPRVVLRLERKPNQGVLVIQSRPPYDMIKHVAIGDANIAFASMNIERNGSVDLVLEDVLNVARNLREYPNFEDAIQDRIKTDEYVEFDFEMMDIPSSKSVLSLADSLDKYGQPLLATDMNLIDERRDVSNKLIEICKSTLFDQGFSLKSFQSTGLVGQHPSGTTRMSELPGDGVVDKDLKIFNSKNIFVLGSSVFPTVGYANPTLTIISLALRLADHLHEKRI